MAPSVHKSPFFRPAEKPDFTSTPGGSRHRRQKTKDEIENKSTLLGCSANLINAIVGSGIVGLPFAVQQAGFVAGIFLIVLCAILTEKSLRLLIETAKHAQVPTYEMVAEAAFGRYGFIFVALNMFIMSYGAMLSYLMIVKDTFSSVFGVAADNYPIKRAILFLISITIIVPLSSQRDMADLAKTSRLNVTFDLLMVLLVLYCAPIAESWQTFEWRDSIIHYDTIFVGLGVLSFAFVCQHSAFIIAGSLDKPTNSRWSTVTKISLTASVALAFACGVGGFIGFREHTEGNILNSLDESVPAKVARGLLGTTMLFVYPMESFVARHVCVVLFFKGRSAHEGDDTSVLNRRDRRITLTMVLYLIAVIPAALFENLGSVLASTGAVGGSCLSYIGPGAIYLGIHGARFLELARGYFGKPGLIAPLSEETTPLNGEPAPKAPQSTDSWPVRLLKTILWYALCMPIWCWIATVGKTCLTSHVTDLAMKSPHPIRIGNVRFAAAKLIGGETRVVMLQNRASSSDDSSKFPTDTMLLRADSLPRDYGTARTTEGRIVALPAKSTLAKGALPTSAPPQKDYQSMTNKAIGENLMAKRRKEQEELDLEDDPQEGPPGVVDFMVAIFYIIFGVVAMGAGLFSIFIENKR